MKLRIKPTPKRLRKQYAFALISTIVLMLLLALLSVGLLTVASTQTRISDKGLLSIEAKAQAKLALEVAIGKLQGELGPDQRISANSGILLESDQGSSSQSPYILGVWNSWDNFLNRENSTGEAITSTYTKGRSALFRRWLISDPNNNTLMDLNAGTNSLGINKKLSNSQRVCLLGGGSLGYTKRETTKNNKEIYAGLVQVDDSYDKDIKANAYNKYIAWWVSGENQKVRVNLPKYKSSKKQDITSVSQGAWDTPAPYLDNLGLNTLSQLAQSNNDFELAKIVSKDSLVMSGNTSSRQEFRSLGDVYHDITLVSQGLLTDNKFGGLKKDLNLLLSLPKLPDEMIGNNKDIGLRPTNSEDGSPSVANRPISSWNQLYLWSNLWNPELKDGQDQSAVLSWSGQTPMTYIASDAEASVKMMDNKHTYVRHPILLRFYSFVGINLIKREYANSMGAGAIDVRVSVIPVFVWWNPYNVDMKLTDSSGNPWFSNYGQYRFMPLLLSHNMQSHGLPLDAIRETYTENPLTPFLSVVYGNRQIADFGASFRDSNILDNSGKANKKGDFSTIKAGEIIVFAQPVSTMAAGAGDRGSVQRAKENGFDIITDNFAFKTGWSQEPNQVSAYAVNLCDGQRYDVLENNSYGRTDKIAKISTKFAESYNDLRGNSGTNDATPKNHVLASKYTEEFDSKSNKLGTFVMAPGLMDVTKIGTSTKLSGSNTADPEIMLKATPATINMNWGAWEQPLMDLIRVPAELWLHKATDDEEYSRKGYAGQAIEDSTFVSYFGISTKWGKTPIVGAYPANKDYRAKTWQHSSPLFWGGQMIKATELGRSYSPYQFEVKQANSTFAPITISNILSNDGTKLSPFGGPGAEQINKIVASELPLQQPYSLAGFAGFRLTPGWYRTDSLPQTAKRFAYQSGVPGVGIGNSFADPMIPGDKVFSNNNVFGDETLADFWDHGFMINDALWDSWYTSSLATRPKDITNPSGVQNVKTVIQEVFATDMSNQKNMVSNKRNVPDGRGLSTSEIVNTLTDQDGYKKSAQFFTVSGAFNINSTSSKAWESVLLGLKDRQLLHSESGKPQEIQSSNAALFSRFGIASSNKSHIDEYGSVGITNGISSNDAQAWSDLRKISESQLKQLAEEMVKQVRKRGPFLNMAEFVNRRLTTDELGIKGALQAAIDNSNINNAFNELSDTIINPAASYPFPAAAKGSAYTAAPGYLIQSDVLAVLGNILTTRDDTFVVRAYGQVTNKAGKILSHAWCEAVVQRSVEYVDPSNSPETAALNLNMSTGAVEKSKLSSINRAFGRRFNIVSFKWLAPEEV